MAIKGQAIKFLVFIISDLKKISISRSIYLPWSPLRIRSGKIHAILPSGNGLVKPKYNFPAGMATGHTEPLPESGREITFRAAGADVFGILSRAGPDEFKLDAAKRKVKSLKS
jgi:hypothetical protein